MRYFEIAGGLRLPVNEEEQEILSLVETQGSLSELSLDERQSEVARKMVSRGLLNRLLKDEEIYYEPNGLQDIWRI